MRRDSYEESETDREKKGRDRAIGITAAEKSEMKRERVEDGSWHNEEEETSEGGCGRREKIPARERATGDAEAKGERGRRG